MRSCALALIFGVCCGFSQAPGEQEHLALLRAYGESYRARLQDFICLKTVTRMVDTSGTGKHWKKLETEVQEMTYARNREAYKLLSVDGDTNNPEKRRKKGFIRVGVEFSILASIFNPKAHADLSPDVRDGDTCVTRYSIPANSPARLKLTSGGRQDVLSHSGRIFAECATGRVTRLEFATSRSNIDNSWLQSAITFGPVKIREKEFMLPVTAVNGAFSDKALTSFQVTFSNYRKYDAATSIQFDTDQQE